MNIKYAIKLCRTARGMSQTALAEKAGVSTSCISRIEQGKSDISISMLENIAGALDTHVETLVFMAADKDKFIHINKDLAKEITDSILQLLTDTKPNEAHS